MAIAAAQYEGAHRFSIPRVCDRCGEPRSTGAKISYERMKSLDPKIREEDQTAISRKIGRVLQEFNAPESAESCLVWCPGCRRLDTRSMLRHFPNGFREGLIEKLNDCVQRTKVSGCLGLLLRLACLAYAGGAVYMLATSLPKLNQGDPLVSQFAIIGTATIVVTALVYVYAFGNTHRRRYVRKAIEAVERASDEEIERLVYFEYFLSGEDLRLPRLHTRYPVTAGQTTINPLRDLLPGWNIGEVDWGQARYQGLWLEELPRKYRCMRPLKRVPVSLAAIRDDYDIRLLKEKAAPCATEPDDTDPLGHENPSHANTGPSFRCKCRICDGRQLPVSEAYAIARDRSIPEIAEPLDKQKHADQNRYVRAIICRATFEKLYREEESNPELTEEILEDSNFMAEQCLEWLRLQRDGDLGIS